MQEKAQVIEVLGDDIVVMVERQSTCQSCQVKAGCGTSVLSKMIGNKIATIKVRNSLHAKLGDSVTIAFDDQLFVLSSFLMYLLPLFAMFAIAILLATIQSSELITMTLAFAGLIFSFLLLNKLIQEPRFLKHFKANLVSVDSNNNAHFSIKLLS